jgi:hypothetical protein
VDVDVLDPGFAPGTGTPEPGGMATADLLLACRRLAEALEHAIVRAERPQRAFTAAVPISPEAVRDAQGALLDLAERLRAPRPVDADGMRLARALLIDGAGPLYVTTRPGELRQAALRALGALDGVRR